MFHTVACVCRQETPHAAADSLVIPATIAVAATIATQMGLSIAAMEIITVTQVNIATKILRSAFGATEEAMERAVARVFI